MNSNRLKISSSYYNSIYFFQAVIAIEKNIFNNSLNDKMK